MSFFKRENNPSIFFIALAFSISFLINSCIITAYVVKNQNVEPTKTLEQVKQSAFTTCVNDSYSNNDKTKCGELLK